MADVTELFNQQRDGWARAMNLTYVSATPDRVEATLTVGPEHLQPMGIVHGGVHCGVIESVCSIGAAVAAAARGHVGGVVGLENHTSFIRAVRPGAVLTAVALPVTRGRTTHVWQAEIKDAAGALIATGRVRLLCVGRDQLG